MSLQLIPFLMLDGNAKEAIRFYEISLEAKVLFKQTYGEAPGSSDQLSMSERDRIAHSVLKIEEAELYIADLVPGLTYRAGNHVNICITTTDIEKVNRFYEALQQDGQVNIPLCETHFSPAYGMVTDKFGTTFQLFAKRSR